MGYFHPGRDCRMPSLYRVLPCALGCGGATTMSSSVRKFEFEPAWQRWNRTAERDGLFLFLGGGLKWTAQTAVIVIQPELYENFILIGQDGVWGPRMACRERCLSASLAGFGHSKEHAHNS